MIAPLYLLPLWIVFELWQLVIAERYIGVKQVRAGLDPRQMAMTERRAFVWSALLFGYWLWMGFVLGTGSGRVQSLCLIITSAIGFTLRRISPLKATIVILTFEGAIRLGMLLSLAGVVLRRLQVF